MTSFLLKDTFKLDVNGTIQKLLTTDYVKDALEGRI